MSSPSGSATSREPDLDLARVRVDLATRAADVTRLSDLREPASRQADLAAIRPVLSDLVLAMVAATGARGAALHVHDPATDELRLHARTGAAPATSAAGGVRRGQGAAGAALAAVDAVTREERGPDGTPVVVHAVPMLTLTLELMGVMEVHFAPGDAGAAARALAGEYVRQAADIIERATLHAEARALLARDRLRSEQLARLAATAQELNGELELDTLLRTVTEAARAIIGCHQAVCSRLVRGWTEAFTYVSLSEKYARWRDYDRVPKGLGVLNYVTRENKPLRLTPAELRAHAEWRGLRDAPDHPPLPNYLAAPLIARDGSNLGLIQLSDKVVPGEEVGDFTAEDEHLLVALCQLAATAIENSELRERERLAGQRVDASARSLKLLSDASRILAETLELDATLETVTRLAVPVLGDWCGVRLPRSDGEGLELAAHAGAAPELDAVLAGVVPDDGDEPEGGAIRRTVRLAALPPRVLAALEAALPDSAPAPGTLLRVPLAAHGRALGELTLVRVPGPPYTEGEAELAEELALRAALAVDNATRYSSERDTALVLQRSMLPEELPRTQGLRVAARYLPGAAGLNVGGDWYDLIPLGDGRTGLVVGDVAGRGIAAATVMGQLRAIVRAYALEGHEPGPLLERVDRFVSAQPEVSLVTCLYGVYDGRDRTLCVASAGHLPPVLLDDRGARLLEVAPGPPLGAGAGPCRPARVVLAREATVLLYTDGLVEERHRPIDVGLDAMLAAAAHWHGSPDALCDGVLRVMAAEHPLDDDTALLAVSLDLAHVPTRDCDVRSLRLRAEPAAARAARAEIADILVACGAEDHVGPAELLVTEVVANAVRHGEGEEVELRVAVDRAAIRVEVHDDGEAPLAPQVPTDAEQAGGRGLMIVEALATRWGYEADGDAGKRVWFEIDREPAPAR